MLVMVAGHLKNNSYEKNGEKIYSLDIVADSVEFLESKAVVDARENAKQAAIEEAAKVEKKTRKRKTTKKAAVA
jgi:single-stranded DNA-binding protein